MNSDNASNQAWLCEGSEAFGCDTLATPSGVLRKHMVLSTSSRISLLFLCFYEYLIFRGQVQIFVCVCVCVCVCVRVCV